MTNSQIERDNRLIRYLLGEMTGEEQENLEGAYFADDALYEELEATEAALIDAYVRGQIPEDIRSRFEGRYLASPRQREKVEFARLLFEKTRKAPPEEQDAIRWWQRIPLPFTFPRRLLLPAAGLSVLAIVIAVSLLLFRSSRPEASLARLDQQAAPAGQRPAEVPPQSTESLKQVGEDVVALSLLPGLTRGEGTRNILQLQPHTKTVRLELRYQGDAYSNYRVWLRTPEGREILRQSGLKVLQGVTKTVVVTIPASRLATGDYIVTLSGSTSAGTHEDLADYSFRIAVN